MQAEFLKDLVSSEKKISQVTYPLFALNSSVFLHSYWDSLVIEGTFYGFDHRGSIRSRSRNVFFHFDQHPS
jgi:hypothetical protein